MDARHASLVATANTATSLSDDDIISKDVVDRGFLTIEDAECFLSTFKVRMIEHFPFVVVPPDMMAEELRRDRPFLFLSIISAASYSNMPLQRKLGEEVKSAIASRMIVNGEVSFDLLQGLLVSLAWCHYHTRPYRYTQFLQLAIGLIIELRLDRPPQTKVWKSGIRFTSNYDPDDDTLTRPSFGRDEQRVVAGCYYLSSTISGLLQKQLTFPYTAYLEECCKSIYDAAEYPYDKSILYIVQLQHIVEKVNRITFQHGMELKNSGSAMELYVLGLKSELEAFRVRSGFTSDETPLTTMQFHTAELSLYQLSLLNKRRQQSGSMQTTLSDDMLYAGGMAAQSILELYLSLPPRSETSFNNTEWVQIGFALIIACRLAAKAPIAEPAVFRQHKESLSNTLMRLKLRVSELSTDMVDMNGDRDVFSNYIDRVARLQAWLDKRLEKTDSSDINNAAPEEPRTIEGTPSLENQQLADASRVIHDSSPSDLFASMANGYPSMEEDDFAYTIDQMLDNWM
ncbi:hypothetical protein MGYG_03007 [Nannizzia gypsea CBS 118893]|uniref:Transcription factor domain-containing protein n=1 Tax=Arthroderma gypseum (strain ATCC MYA-4604 / CBS 118893) TaxID=535722 RepID=E4UQ80_ARTGP|nr:hypothetical protein MGYG_03007 [Nannizzia gypsea CBS 118893]EFQ99999.1 hypothetical protein MGYG_03007 [Nannizzia gypsea CBS 118893]